MTKRIERAHTTATQEMHSIIDTHTQLTPTMREERKNKLERYRKKQLEITKYLNFPELRLLYDDPVAVIIDEVNYTLRLPPQLFTMFSERVQNGKLLLSVDISNTRYHFLVRDPGENQQKFMGEDVNPQTDPEAKDLIPVAFAEIHAELVNTLTE